MCGLVGMMGDFNAKHKDAMNDLLFLDSLRGPDATGVAAIRGNGDVTWYKQTVPGYDYIQHQAYKNLLSFADRVWLGHNRFGTVGKNIRLNAHPFVVELSEKAGWDLIGAHNGTLKNKYKIDPDNKFGTDSEALLNLIAKDGPKEAIAQVEGAWALTWYDGVDEALFMLRNKERPLSFIYSKDRKTVVWGSEIWMIRAACSRNGIELENVAVTIKEDHLYRFDQPDKDGVIPEPKVEGGVTGKPEPVTGGFWSGYGRYEEDWKAKQTHLPQRTQATGATGTNSTTTSATSTGGKFPNPKPGQIRGFEGEPLDLSDAKLLLSLGCTWCADPIDEKASFGWLDKDAPICSKCLRGNHYHDPATGENNETILLTPKQKEALNKLREQKQRQEEQLAINQAAKG